MRTQRLEKSVLIVIRSVLFAFLFWLVGTHFVFLLFEKNKYFAIISFSEYTSTSLSHCNERMDELGPPVKKMRTASGEGLPSARFSPLVPSFEMFLQKPTKYPSAAYVNDYFIGVIIN